MNVYTPYMVNHYFTDIVKDFTTYLSDKDIITSTDWSYSSLPLNVFYKFTPYYDIYIYSFIRITIAKYIGFSVSTYLG